MVSVLIHPAFCSLLDALAAHPTLNRHSPTEVVANFKRRVPPRLPKPRKRETQEAPTIPPPRSAVGVPSVPLSVPSSVGTRNGMFNGRARGFSAPGSFTPLSQGSAAGWGSYRNALPPLTVPSDSPHGMYSQSQGLQSISPTEDSPTAQFSAMASGTGYPQHTPQVSSSQSYSYTEPGWSFSPNNSTSSHSGSLSSLLNPPTGSAYSTRPTPTINTSYTPSYSSVSMHSDNTPPSLSPDTHSRPTTGYSISSVSSLPYEESPPHHTYQHGDYSRPGSSHHRSGSPTLSRPPSSSKQYGPSSLTGRVGRPRRHSQAMSPYPSPYDHHTSERTSSSPHPADDVTMPRVRSMAHPPTVDPYGFTSGQAEFAYSAVGSNPSMDSMDRNGWGHHAQRPSTSASSISAASHTSSSQAHTPPLDGYADTDINRCEFYSLTNVIRRDLLTGSFNQSHLTLGSWR